MSAQAVALLVLLDVAIVALLALDVYFTYVIAQSTVRSSLSVAPVKTNTWVPGASS